VSLFFYAALLVGVYLFLRRVFGVKDTKKDQEFRSNVSASFGNALPKAFGGMSSANLPEPDTSDGLAPHGDNVLVLDPPSKPTYHPFRDGTGGEARNDEEDSVG
jgi:hypothetical protein